MSFEGAVNGFTVDSNNTTTDALAASATYTGTATDVSEYNQIHVTMKQSPNVVPDGDGNTAQGSMYVEFSPDGTNWDVSIPIVVRSGIFIPQTYIVIMQWFRIRYINDGGSSAISALGLSETADTARTQTAFRLTSILLRGSTKELGRTIDQSISGSDPVSLTRSVILGRDPDANFVNILASSEAELYTTTSESDLNSRVLYNATGISSDTYAVLIDLSDTTNFPHSSTGRIDISSIKAALELANNSVGTLKVGLITRIDGTNADIEYFFVVPFEKSATRRILSINDFSPSRIKGSITSNAWADGITNITETNVTAVNTGASLGSANGNISPGLGDIIVKYDHTSGSAWDALIEAFYRSQT